MADSFSPAARCNLLDAEMPAPTREEGDAGTSGASNVDRSTEHFAAEAGSNGAMPKLSDTLEGRLSMASGIVGPMHAGKSKLNQQGEAISSGLVDPILAIPALAEDGSAGGAIALQLPSFDAFGGSRSTPCESLEAVGFPEVTAHNHSKHGFDENAHGPVHIAVEVASTDGACRGSSHTACGQIPDSPPATRAPDDSAEDDGAGYVVSDADYLVAPTATERGALRMPIADVEDGFVPDACASVEVSGLFGFGEGEAEEPAFAEEAHIAAKATVETASTDATSIGSLETVRCKNFDGDEPTIQVDDDAVTNSTFDPDVLAVQATADVGSACGASVPRPTFPDLLDGQPPAASEQVSEVVAEHADVQSKQQAEAFPLSASQPQVAIQWTFDVLKPRLSLAAGTVEPTRGTPPVATHEPDHRTGSARVINPEECAAKFTEGDAKVEEDESAAAQQRKRNRLADELRARLALHSERTAKECRLAAKREADAIRAKLGGRVSEAWALVRQMEAEAGKEEAILKRNRRRLQDVENRTRSTEQRLVQFIASTGEASPTGGERESDATCECRIEACMGELEAENYALEAEMASASAEGKEEADNLRQQCELQRQKFVGLNVEARELRVTADEASRLREQLNAFRERASELEGFMSEFHSAVDQREQQLQELGKEGIALTKVSCRNEADWRVALADSRAHEERLEEELEVLAEASCATDALEHQLQASDAAALQLEANVQGLQSRVGVAMVARLEESAAQEEAGRAQLYGHLVTLHAAGEESHDRVAILQAELNTMQDKISALNIEESDDEEIDAREEAEVRRLENTLEDLRARSEARDHRMSLVTTRLQRLREERQAEASGPEFGSSAHGKALRARLRVAARQVTQLEGVIEQRSSRQDDYEKQEQERMLLRRQQQLDCSPPQQPTMRRVWTRETLFAAAAASSSAGSTASPCHDRRAVDWHATAYSSGRCWAPVAEATAGTQDNFESGRLGSAGCFGERSGDGGAFASASRGSSSSSSTGRDWPEASGRSNRNGALAGRWWQGWWSDDAPQPWEGSARRASGDAWGRSNGYGRGAYSGRSPYVWHAGHTRSDRACDACSDDVGGDYFGSRAGGACGHGDGDADGSPSFANAYASNAYSANNRWQSNGAAADPGGEFARYSTAARRSRSPWDGDGRSWHPGGHASSRSSTGYYCHGGDAANAACSGDSYRSAWLGSESWQAAQGGPPPDERSEEYALRRWVGAAAVAGWRWSRSSY